MSTYDVRCKVCGEEYEITKSMSAPLPRNCMKCGDEEDPLEQVITSCKFALKGEGWFSTDPFNKV